MANRPKRPQPGEGRTSHSNIDGSAIAAAFGGGGKTAGYDQASSEVQAGTLSSPGDDYDPRAATSPRGVLTPELQKAYDTGPTQPLNWLGKAARLPDLYSQFQMQRAGMGEQSLINQKLEANRFQHETEMEAIKHSNLTLSQKQQAELMAKNRLEEMNNSVLTSRGFIANPANVGAMNSATAGLIPSLAPTMMQQGVEHTAANIGLINSEALKNRFGHLGAGDVVFPYGQLGPGMSAMNLHPSDRENEMAAATKQPPLASGLTYYLNGRAIQAKSGAQAGGGGLNAGNAGFGDAAAGGLGLGSGVPQDWHPPMSPPGGNPAIGGGGVAGPSPNTFGLVGPAANQSLPAVGRWILNNLLAPSAPGYSGGMAPQAPTMADLIKQQEEEKRRQQLMVPYPY